MGCCAAGRASVGIIYLMELVPKESASNVCTLSALLDSSIMIFCTIYFMYISKESYYWEMYALCANLASAAVIVFIAPESPKYLYDKKQF